MAHDSPTRGDWVAWVGTFDDIVRRNEGQARLKLDDMFLQLFRFDATPQRAGFRARNLFGLHRS